jgi:hypothetical protein
MKMFEKPTLGGSGWYRSVASLNPVSRMLASRDIVRNTKDAGHDARDGVLSALVPELAFHERLQSVMIHKAIEQEAFGSLHRDTSLRKSTLLPMRVPLFEQTSPSATENGIYALLHLYPNIQRVETSL